jgi:hypothetical protein
VKRLSKSKVLRPAAVELGSGQFLAINNKVLDMLNSFHKVGIKFREN